jgi:hypothetical protein
VAICNPWEVTLSNRSYFFGSLFVASLRSKHYLTFKLNDDFKYQLTRFEHTFWKLCHNLKLIIIVDEEQEIEAKEKKKQQEIKLKEEIKQQRLTKKIIKEK